MKLLKVFHGNPSRGVLLDRSLMLPFHTLWRKDIPDECAQQRAMEEIIVHVPVPQTPEDRGRETIDT